MKNMNIKKTIATFNVNKEVIIKEKKIWNKNIFVQRSMMKL